MVPVQILLKDICLKTIQRKLLEETDLSANNAKNTRERACSPWTEH